MTTQTQLPFFSAGTDLPLFREAVNVKPTLADLLKTEALALDGFVYSSFPYSCGLTEALVHAARHPKPTDRQLTIEREPQRITITIKPRKGTGRRKPLVIRLWV